MNRATFAAGCFWGVEARFARTRGVTATRVGYTGGATEQPTYREVCSDTTGHAEAVEVSFDPQQTSFAELLEVFWDCHDPTALNRQGPDVGSQYRSAIFCHDEAQQVAALHSRAQAQPRFMQPIVTAIEAAVTFWPAEEYHQRYFEKHGAGLCGQR